MCYGDVCVCLRGSVPRRKFVERHWARIPPRLNSTDRFCATLVGALALFMFACDPDIVSFLRYISPTYCPIDATTSRVRSLGDPAMVGSANIGIPTARYMGN